MTLNRPDYIALLNSLIPDNATQEISPEDVRTVLTDLVESIPYFITDKEITALNVAAPDVRTTRLGDSALYQNMTNPATYSEDNTALGYYSLGPNYSGVRNTAAGSYSLGCNLYGNDNAGLGFLSLAGNLTGSGNVGLGNYTLRNNKSGKFNIAIGHGAGNNIDQTSSFKFYLGSYPIAYSDSGRDFTHLMYGDLQNPKLAIAARTLHNYGVLQVSGSLTPVTDKQGSLGHPYMAWGEAHLGSGLSYAADRDFVISLAARPFASQFDLQRMVTLTSGKKIGFGNALPSGHLGFVTIDGDVVPATDGSYSLGHPSLKWNGVFKDIIVSGTANINNVIFTTKTECLYTCKTLHLATSGLCPDDIFQSSVCGYLTDEGLDGAGFEIHASGDFYRRDYRWIYRSPDQSLTCLEQDSPYARSCWQSNISVDIEDGNHLKTQRVLSENNLSLVSQSGCFGAFIRPNKFTVGNEPLLSSGNYEVNFVFGSGFNVLYASHGSGLSITHSMLSRNNTRGFISSYIDNKDIVVSGQTTDRYVLSSKSKSSGGGAEVWLHSPTLGGQTDSSLIDILTVLRTGNVGISNSGQFIPQSNLNIQSVSGCETRITAINGNAALQLLSASNMPSSGFKVSFTALNNQNISGTRTLVDLSVVSPSGTNGAISIAENNYVSIGKTTNNEARVFEAHAPITVRHDGSLSGTVSLKSQSVAPSNNSGYGKFYVKPFITGLQTESLFFLDGSNNEYNLILNQNELTQGLVYTDSFLSTYAGRTPNTRPLSSTSQSNTVYGYRALNALTTGSGNSVFGASSASFANVSNNNTIIGHNSFAASGSRNIVIGSKNLSSSLVKNLDNTIIIGHDIPYDIIENNYIAIGHGSTPLVLGSISGTRTFYVKNATFGVFDQFNEQEFSVSHTSQGSRKVHVLKSKDYTSTGNNDSFVSLRFFDQNDYSRTLVDFDYHANPIAITPIFDVPSPLRPFVGVSGDIKLLGAVRFADGTFLETATLNAELNFYDLEDALNIATNFTTENSYLAMSVPSGGGHYVGRITLQSLSDYVGSGFAAVGNNCNHVWSNAENAVNKTNNSSSVFIGCNVAAAATGWKHSVMIGTNAGAGATTPNVGLATDTASVFIGYNAGQNADDTSNTIAIGTNAGYAAINSQNSTYIGSNAGYAHNGANCIGIGRHALRSSGVSFTGGANNIEIVAGLLDNQRLMYGSGSLSNCLNIQNAIAGNTSSNKISIGHATLNPDAPLSVRRNEFAVPGHANNSYIQTWWCNGVKVAHIDCFGNFSGSAGGGGGVSASGVIEGLAAQSVSAPSTPSVPTSGLVTIKDANWNTIGSVYVLNRDTNLTVPNGAYVQAVAINGTYKFQWVSCGA